MVSVIFPHLSNYPAGLPLFGLPERDLVKESFNPTDYTEMLFQKVNQYYILVPSHSYPFHNSKNSALEVNVVLYGENTATVAL